MQTSIDRRSLLRGAAATAGLALARFLPDTARAAAIPPAAPAAKKLGWELAVAQYTFRRFSLYETLPFLAQLGVDRLEPAFFLKLDRARPELKSGDSLTPELRAELRERLASNGVRLSGYYAKVESDETATRAAFQFAKEMGIPTIVSEPPPDAMGMVERLCEEFQVDLAIHNHPRSPKSLYWDPQNVLASCKGRSRRIGACCDTGHWVRSALDPIECIKKMEGRILSIHLKDVGEIGNPKAEDVPLGTGKANYGEILKQLHRQGFKGVLSVEYEHDTEKELEATRLIADVRECIAFVERTAATLA